MAMSTGQKWGIAALVSGVGLGVLGAILLGRRSSQLHDAHLGRARVLGKTTSNGKTLTHYREANMPIGTRVRLLQELVYKSVQDPEMRKLALQITKGCPARDGDCEARAIDRWVRAHVRYTGDVGALKLPGGKVEGIDLFQTAARTVEFAGGDCLPSGTLLLAEGHHLVPIERLTKGTRIWGLDDWTMVEDVWSKGMLPVDVVALNNGSSFKATGDHKVFVALCDTHPVKFGDGRSCSCPMSERSIERLTVSQLEPGMVLTQPKRIAFGAQTMDVGRAYVEGLYASDGSSGHETSFDIAGQDGCPKEAQKAEVAAICERLGIPTTMQRKYISVRDRDWTQRLHSMGLRAPQKHLLSLDLDEVATTATVRGILADAGRNSRGGGSTFTSTSRELTVQTRVLLRMLGISCGERYIVDHGGLGENPIWRLQLRCLPEERNDGKAEKLLRVRAIDREVLTLPTWDLTTTDHRVYLPESDVTISQCDDQSVLNATLLALNGITPKFRITGAKGWGDTWSHIYTMAALPKLAPTKLVALDTTLPGDRYGVEVPFGKKIDFPA